MPTVTVTSPVSVIVDGVPYGAPADVIANNPALASLVQVALVAYVDGLTAKHAHAIDAQAKAHADQVQALAEQHDAAVSALMTAHEQSSAAASAQFNALSEKHAAALASLAAMTTDRDQHKGRAETAEASLAELTVAKLKTDGDLASVTAERDTMKARLDVLERRVLFINPDGTANWDAIRAERDHRLALCDWTQLADSPLSGAQREAWAAYRKALRDIPEAFPDGKVIWPVAPGA